ncbi:MAG: cysteine--tRNA ligase [Thermodesulfobacteriota bacterium]
MNRKYGNILDLIGNTPLVPIRHISGNPGVALHAKLESFNPGGSIKDRVALSMIEEAERSGQLSKEKVIVEATSGNTGIGLALVAAIKGYRLMLTMSESVSEERKKILRALGTELRFTPSHLGTDGAIEDAYNLARQYPYTYWLADQFNNESNWKAHYHGTAVEIWEQTGGTVTAVVAAMGTTGTVMGLSRRLKEYNPRIQVIGVEPYLGHKLQGMKNLKESYRPEIFDKNLLDRIVHIDDDTAFEVARRLAKEEGIFAGMSSGAAMAAALDVSRVMKQGLVVVICPDSGERYLSTDLFTDRKKTGIRFYNTLSRQIDEFIPLKEKEVTMYSCGPTVSKLINLGECRRYVVADLLKRYLEYKGFDVSHIINITDLDDRTIQAADAAGQDLRPFTDTYYQRFLEDMDSLHIKRATNYPRASEHVDEMIDTADKLIERGFAYERLRSVYFDISRFQDYGKLSRVNLDKIRVGKTVDLDQYEKDNPRDFTLLKRSTLHELKQGFFFPTKWGNLRPSWHIQCAAIAMKYLGATYDIHIGGVDLIFPHHENDIAISGALTGKPLSNYWLHNDLIREKGSGETAKGSALTLREVFKKGYSGRDVRFWLIQTHYKRAIYFSWAKLAMARNTVSRLDRFVHKLRTCKKGPSSEEVNQFIYDLTSSFGEAMDEDLNISKVLAGLFEFSHKVNRYIDSYGLDRSDREKIEQELAKINSVLMIMDFSEKGSDRKIENMVKDRNAARERRDWAKADAIRQELRELGILVVDTPEGTTWRTIS